MDGHGAFGGLDPRQHQACGGLSLAVRLGQVDRARCGGGHQLVDGHLKAPDASLRGHLQPVGHQVYDVVHGRLRFLDLTAGGENHVTDGGDPAYGALPFRRGHLVSGGGVETGAGPAHQDVLAGGYRQVVLVLVGEQLHRLQKHRARSVGHGQAAFGDLHVLHGQDAGPSLGDGGIAGILRLDGEGVDPGVQAHAVGDQHDKVIGAQLMVVPDGEVALNPEIQVPEPVHGDGAHHQVGVLLIRLEGGEGDIVVLLVAQVDHLLGGDGAQGGHPDGAVGFQVVQGDGREVGDDDVTLPAQLHVRRGNLCDGGEAVQGPAVQGVGGEQAVFDLHPAAQSGKLYPVAGGGGGFGEHHVAFLAPGGDHDIARLGGDLQVGVDGTGDVPHSGLALPGFNLDQVGGGDGGSQEHVPAGLDGYVLKGEEDRRPQGHVLGIGIGHAQEHVLPRCKIDQVGVHRAFAVHPDGGVGHVD